MSAAPRGPGGGLSNSKLALADAGTGDVLAGKRFYAGDKAIKTGTMPNNGAVSATLAPGGSYTVPKGYHNGGGKVTAGSIRYLTSLGITVGYDNNNTTTDGTINLSSYGVSGKSASDFIIGITRIVATTAQKEDRNIESIKVVSFSNNTLRIRITHTGGFGHAIKFACTVAIYVK